MALFKYAGTADELATKKIHDGYVYVCSEDDPAEYERGKPLMGQWFVDIGNARYRLAAAALIDSQGNIVDIDDLVQSGDILEIAQGGTGKETLTKNALLLGNDTDPVGEVVSAAGALMVDTAGEAPNYGVVPVKFGGTGGATAAVARDAQHLDVYSRSEADAVVSKATTFSYTRTLALSGWQASGDNYVQSVEITELRCGKNGNVPPLVTWTGTEDSYKAYCKIVSGEATPNQGIQFQVTGDDMPESDIQIIVVDVA